MSTTHPELEYAVDGDTGERVFDNFKDAAAFALSLACSRGEVNLDVLVWGVNGARAYGGDSAVERYLEDPEASVFERFEISVNCAGSVP